MNYLCLEKVILSNDCFPAIELIYDASVSQPRICQDFNKQCTRITYSEDCPQEMLEKYIQVKGIYPEGETGGIRARAEAVSIDCRGRLRDRLIVTAPDKYGLVREYMAEGASYSLASRGMVCMGSSPQDFVAELVRMWPLIHPESPVILSAKEGRPQTLVITSALPGEAGNQISYKFYNRNSEGGREHHLHLPEDQIPDIDGSLASSVPVPLVAGDQLLNRFEVIFSDPDFPDRGEAVYSIRGSNRTNLNFHYVQTGKTPADFAANIARFWDRMYPDCPVSVSVSRADASALCIKAKNPGAKYNSVKYRAYSDDSGFSSLSGGADPLVPVPVAGWKDALLSIKPGIYVLCNEIVVNGFHMVLSESVRGLVFRQFILRNIPTVYVDKDSIREQCVTVLCPKDVLLSVYLNRINECGHIYIREFDPDFKIADVHAVQTIKANHISVRTTAMVPVMTEKLFVETSDYIAALIRQLQSRYPDVLFYNYPPDADDSKYHEFVFYRAHPEQMDGRVITTPVMSDPVYGDVIRTTCYVEFEYHTHDMLKFNKRRFDFTINRFISDYTTASLTIPRTDHKFLFSVIWNRESAATEGNYNKQLSLVDSAKAQLSFQFVALLTVTIYRLKANYPINVQTIVNQYEGPDSSTKLITRWINDYRPGNAPSSRREFHYYDKKSSGD